jgi:hypothetical protein
MYLLTVKGVELLIKSLFFKFFLKILIYLAIRQRVFSGFLREIYIWCCCDDDDDDDDDGYDDSVVVVVVVVMVWVMLVVITSVQFHVQ